MGMILTTVAVEMFLSAVMQRQLAVEPLITHRFPNSRVAEAFVTAANDPTAIKAVIEFQ